MFLLRDIGRRPSVWVLAAAVVAGAAHVAAAEAPGRPVVGMYGVPAVQRDDPGAVAGRLRSGGVDAVFVPAEKASVRFYRGQGFRVFASMNVFGGRGAWKAFPDSRPVLADGRRLGEDGDRHGGVCPTHPAWRRERLREVERIAGLQDAGLSGLWLDFARYPGFWETPTPVLPDACYCPRCLQAFRSETGTPLPADLKAGPAAAWIRAHAPRAWVSWKKRQIGSFVAQAREAASRRSAPSHPDRDGGRAGAFRGDAPAKIGNHVAGGPGNAPAPTLPDGGDTLSSFAHAAPAMRFSALSSLQGKRPLPPGGGPARSVSASAVSPASAPEAEAGLPEGRRFLLGAFVVPWTQGERDAAVLTLLAQDAFGLAEQLDVLSPMIYHRMCGRDPAWIAGMTAYFRERAACPVWPIVQSAEVPATEFRRAVDAAARGGAPGILVFSYRGMP